MTDKAYEYVSERLNSFVESGWLRGFEVKEAYILYDRHNWREKIVDWVKWRSPFRKFFPKGEHVLLPFEEVYADLQYDMESEEWAILVRCMEGKLVWKYKPYTDPFNQLICDVVVQPVMPLNYVKLEILDEREK